MGNRKQPFGYRMENGKIVIHPEEADMVQSVFRNYLSGMGFANLAEKLNEQGLSYYPGKPWNKNMVARLLEDGRYIGTKDYPALIDEETLAAAAAIRSEKNIPCGVTPTQKALRRICGTKPSPCMVKTILRTLNRLIADPTLIQSPSQEKKDAPKSTALEAKLDKLLAEQPVDEPIAKQMVFRLAATRYDEIGDGEYETERLCEIFNRSKPMNELDTDLLLDTISNVSEHDGKIKITLKNGQIIEGGIDAKWQTQLHGLL